MKKKLTLNNEFRQLCPHFRVGTIAFRIDNSGLTGNKLDQLFEEEIKYISRSYTLASWKERIPIRATREAYKACGKDPNRYRPSAEQLGRRILNGLDLYRVNPLVDFGNLISLKTGYSIGVFDEEHIVGEELVLRLGTSEDVYEGIGRGLLNIDRLPVYTDNQGPFASATSDSVRTMILPSSENILIFINGYADFPQQGTDDLSEAVILTGTLVKELFSIQKVDIEII